jgi:hypothetical protein
VGESPEDEEDYALEKQRQQAALSEARYDNEEYLRYQYDRDGY